ncbi:T9SS type A sorting domain-containing protein [Aquimarina algiphila]|uniref:T9SS type A sorting domain-containing protein n=1 Tax=Aquimarina algiphila TaxID=2047982 RepID=UPI00232DE074|nr:T9SS type A sorting domain-containing protein [Aquimarina algiphila]
MKKLLLVCLFFILGNQFISAQADYIDWEFRGGRILSNPDGAASTSPGPEPAGLYVSGSPTVIPTSDGRLPSAILVDLDNDNDLDFISGSQRGTVHYFENTGTVTAPNWVLGSIPSLEAINIFVSTTVRNQNRPQLADIDDDGDLDLFIGTERNFDGVRDDEILFYRNIGTPEVPVFEFVPDCLPGLLNQDIAEYPGLGFVDLDNDTDLDLVALGSDRLTYYKNIGTKESPHFELQSEADSPWDDEDAYSNMDVPIPVFEDFDKDGDYDMYFMIDTGFVKWIENVGTVTNPHFAAPQIDMDGELTNADIGDFPTVSFGDVTGDGLKDAILANFNAPRFAWFRQVPVCVDPVITNVTATPVLCEGETSTITITGTLNIASKWSIYTDSYGGTLLGTTTTNTSTFEVIPTAPSTTYYIRGEDGDISCIDETTATGMTVTIMVNAIDDPSFNYDAANYCKGDINPTPTISGVTGGVFSSTAGLSINSTTGEIDIAASIAGSYTVTYTTTGSCPDSSDVMVIITDLDDATFTYENSAYCADATNPIPNVTGITGGTFSSTLGLIIDSNSGEINLVESTPGTYTITYTTSGICSNSSTADITINALPDATVTENSLTFTADTTGATYQWINCETNQPISGETSISFTATENGSYAVDITLNGCTNRSSCILVDSIVLQQEDTISNFKLYPNPTDGIINVTIPVQKISIFNYYGRKVFEASTSTFDISSLGSGIYFMEVETGNGRTTRKIVRQ